MRSSCPSCERIIPEPEKASHCPFCLCFRYYCDTCAKYHEKAYLDSEATPLGWLRAKGLQEGVAHAAKQICEECMIVAQRGKCRGCSRITSHKVNAVIGSSAVRGTQEWRRLLTTLGMDRDNYYVRTGPVHYLQAGFFCLSCEKVLQTCVKCDRKAPSTRTIRGLAVCLFCLQTRHAGPCNQCEAESFELAPGTQYCIPCAALVKPCEVCGKRARLYEGFCHDCMRVGNHEARAEDEFQFMMPACHVDCVSSVKHKDTCTFDGQFVGVELEVECGQRDRGIVCAQVRQTLKRGMLVKHDGSLANGLEIVSPPAYLGWHMENWRPLFEWNNTKKVLRSHDTGTCGLHVHISRAPLTEDQIYNAVTFLHNPRNREFVALIAGRPSNHYYDFSAPKGAFGREYDVESDRYNRYTALNLCNPKTIEYRLFRGTMNWDSFAARLEFAKFLTLFAGVIKNGDDMTHEQFLAWIEKRDDAPALQKYLARGNLIKWERK